jgi:hypothetical protein
MEENLKLDIGVFKRYVTRSQQNTHPLVAECVVTGVKQWLGIEQGPHKLPVQGLPGSYVSMPSPQMILFLKELKVLIKTD